MLTLRPKQHLLINGPTQCGKSTLLRAIIQQIHKTKILVIDPKRTEIFREIPYGLAPGARIGKLTPNDYDDPIILHAMEAALAEGNWYIVVDEAGRIMRARKWPLIVERIIYEGAERNVNLITVSHQLRDEVPRYIKSQAHIAISFWSGTGIDATELAARGVDWRDILPNLGPYCYAWHRTGDRIIHIESPIGHKGSQKKGRKSK